ncbi:MAG: hypothetical protein ABMB14_19135, partial [Myxococcota bacterium]
MWWWMMGCATGDGDAAGGADDTETGVETGDDDDDGDDDSVPDPDTGTSTGTSTGTTIDHGTGPDADGDTFGDDVDCDDSDATMYPGAPDVCGDDRVTDCRRSSDDGLITVDGGATFTALADALAAASTGSVVLVCPGLYLGPSAATVALTVASHGGRDLTTLDGDGAGPTLSVQGGSTITGLTITGGRASSGGGVQLASPGSLSVLDCEIRGNTAEVAGGGLYAADAAVDLTGTVVRDNATGAMGGGVALDGGSLTGGELLYNVGSPYQSMGGGGGLHVTGLSTITGTRVASNTAEDGGGISVDGWYTVTEVSLVDVIVEDNVAGYGGGLWVRVASVSLDGTTEIRGNDAVSEGGGANLDDGASMAGGAITDNHAYDGGGIKVANGTLAGTTVSGNTADGSAGGVLPSGDVTLDGVVIVSNAAPEGGGLGSPNPWGQVDVSGGAILSNHADNSGGGVYARSDLTLDGVELSDNTADWGGGMLVAS